jgi:putative membrane protein
VAEVASGGMLEVRLGQYASANAADIAVRHFGENMVDDHSKANEELRTLASEKSIETPKVLAQKDQEVLDRLEKLTGGAFDKGYMTQMVEDHKATIALFEKEVCHGTDVRVKGFAEKTLPTLRRHLQMAETTAAKVQ